MSALAWVASVVLVCLSEVLPDFRLGFQCCCPWLFKQVLRRCWGWFPMLLCLFIYAGFCVSFGVFFVNVVLACLFTPSLVLVLGSLVILVVLVFLRTVVCFCCVT